MGDPGFVVRAEEQPAWAEIVRRAERGESVPVIAHGDHVADIVPSGELDRLRETIEVLSNTELVGDLREGLADFLLETDLTPEDLFDEVRQRGEKESDVNYYRCIVRQPLDEHLGPQVHPGHADEAGRRVDLTPIRGAIRSEQMVVLDYADVTGQQTRRTVWPIALAFFERAGIIHEQRSQFFVTRIGHKFVRTS